MTDTGRLKEGLRLFSQETRDASEDGRQVCEIQSEIGRWNGQPAASAPLRIRAT